MKPAGPVPQGQGALPRTGGGLGGGDPSQAVGHVWNFGAQGLGGKVRCHS